MAILPVPGSITNSASKLAVIPPGVNSVTITVAAVNTTIVYIGTASGVTTTSGAPIVGGASVTLTGWPASTGTTLYAIANVAGPTPVGVFISTAA